MKNIPDIGNKMTLEMFGALCALHSATEAIGAPLTITSAKTIFGLRKKAFDRILVDLCSAGCVSLRAGAVHLVHEPMQGIKVPHMGMWHLVYKITNIKTGRYYIGKTNADAWNKGYMGGGDLIRADVDYLGADAFTRDVLYLFTNERDAFVKESALIARSPESSYNVSRPRAC